MTITESQTHLRITRADLLAGDVLTVRRTGRSTQRVAVERVERRRGLWTAVLVDGRRVHLGPRNIIEVVRPA